MFKNNIAFKEKLNPLGNVLFKSSVGWSFHFAPFNTYPLKFKTEIYKGHKGFQTMPK